MTKAELAFLATHPDALRPLADYHSHQETMADACGMTECADHHQKKRERYTELANQQQARIDNGEDPLPDDDNVGILVE